MLHKGVLEEEKSASSFFQQMPFYYIEIAKLLFHGAVESFGDEYLEVSGRYLAYCRCDPPASPLHLKVTGLLESIRKVRYNKIEMGLRKVSEAITVKLNNLSAAECNMIRNLFKGTLDTFHQISKVSVSTSRCLSVVSVTGLCVSSIPLCAE